MAEERAVGEQRVVAPRRKDVQGLRAVAVVLVVAYHAGLPAPGGFVGVDVFLVISGFVIASALLRQLGAHGRVGFGSFYARRARRLLPALALLTTFVALASTLLLSPLGPQQDAAATGRAATLFAANLQLARVPGGYFDLSADTNALLHTWSLSVEEQFYLLFPAALLAVWLLARRFPIRRSSRPTLLALVAAASAASFALCVLTTERPITRLGTQFAFYSVATRAWEFGVGALLAVLGPRPARAATKTSEVVAAGCGALGAAALAVAVAAFSTTTSFPGAAALLPVAAAALLIAAGTIDPGAWCARALATRPAVWVGDLSYGWYLWHWPLLVFTQALWPGRGLLLAVVGAASVLPAAASRRFVEDPIRFDGRRVGRRVLPLVAVCLAVPLLAFVGLGQMSRAEQRAPSVRAFSRDLRLHADRARGCDQQAAIDQRTGSSRCTWKASDPRGQVYLVGDSNAGQFTEPVVAAANRAGYDAVVATSAGCPFVAVEVQNALKPAGTGAACLRSVQRSVEVLARRRPALVVVAASTTEYVQDGDIDLRSSAGGAVASTPSAKADLWRRGLAEVLAPLQAAGVPVVVVHAIPQFGDSLGASWQASTCPALRIWNGSCGQSRSRAAARADQRLGREAEQRAVRGAPGASAVAFDRELCPDPTCRTRLRGVWTYRDATHLSVPGAELLTDRFSAVVRQQARRG